jgi:hypothetical protein
MLVEEPATERGVEAAAAARGEATDLAVSDALVGAVSEVDAWHGWR